MTKVEFFNENGRITRFSVSGHSGYAEKGQDIVCAYITAVVTMAEATLNDVLGANAKVRENAEEPRITLTLPANCEEESAVQAVLTGMMLTLSSLRDNYPDYIEVLEV
ncbi:MAG: ribosomal-processing cysteine protease Prp [Oscillospiraceae bacterium]|nr:ribosomal-processing cysteine protease Prp [Oscillospiraceae bacterium]